ADRIAEDAARIQQIGSLKRIEITVHANSPIAQKEVIDACGQTSRIHVLAIFVTRSIEPGQIEIKLSGLVGAFASRRVFKAFSEEVLCAACSSRHHRGGG